MDRAENQRRMQEALAKKGFAPTWGDRARLFGEGVGRRLAPIGEALYEGTIGFLDDDLTESARGKIMGAPPLPPPGDPNEIFVTAPRRTIGQRIETIGNDVRASLPGAIETWKDFGREYVNTVADNITGRGLVRSFQEMPQHAQGSKDIIRGLTYGPVVDTFREFQRGDEAFRAGDERKAADKYASSGFQALLGVANVLGIGELALGGRAAQSSGKLQQAAEIAGVAKAPPLEMPADFAPTPPRTDITMSERTMAKAANRVDESPPDQFAPADRVGPRIPSLGLSKTETALGIGALGAAATADAMDEEEGINPITLAPAMFIGVIGARNLAKATGKTELLDKMAKAEQMAAQGASREDIWSQTGWFKGVDGKWRTEIDDSGALLTDKVGDGIRDNGIYQGTLGDALEHQEFFGAYPELADEAASIGVQRRSSGQRHRGTVDGERLPGMTVVYGPNAGAQRSTLLHEGQHGAQDFEGFARGGSNTSAFMSDEMRPEWWAEVQRRLTPPSFEEFAANSTFDGVDPAEVRRQYDNMVASLDEARRDPYNPLSKSAQESAAQDMYRRLAGEVEARNVQTRRDMSMPERMALPPWATQDVPDDQQIVRFGSGTAASVGDDFKRIEQLTNEARVWRERRAEASQTGDKEAWQRAHDRLIPIADELTDLTGHPMGLDDPSVASRFARVGEDFTPDATLISEAVKRFGTTTVPEQAGYILPDGRMLNFGEYGIRGEDHRAVAGLPGIVGDQTAAMTDFMNKTGAVRVDLASGLFETQRPPTQRQIETAVRAARKKGLSLRIEASRPDGSSKGSIDLDRPTTERVASFFEEQSGGKKFFNIPAMLGPAAAAAGIGAAAIGGAPEARAEDQSEPFDPGYEVVIRPDADYSGGQWQRQRMQRVPLPDGSEGVIVPWRVKETGEERLVLRALENGVPADIIGEVKPTLGGPIRPTWPGENQRGIGENYPTGRAPPYDLIPIAERDAGNEGAATGAVAGIIARLATMRGLRGAQGVNTGGLLIGPTVGALAGAGSQLVQDADAGDVIKGTIGGAIGGSAGSIGTDLARVGARDVAIPALRFVDDKVSDAIRYKQLWPQRRGPAPGLFEGATQQDMRDALFQLEDARNAELARRGPKIPPLFPDTSVPPPYEYDKWPKTTPGGGQGGAGGGSAGAGAGGAGGGSGGGAAGGASSGAERTPRTPREPMDPAVIARMERAAATGLKGKPVGDLRKAGEVLGVPGATSMRKDDLVKEIARRMAADGQRSNRLLRQAGISLGLAGALAIPALEPPTTDSAPAPF